MPTVVHCMFLVIVAHLTNYKLICTTYAITSPINYGLTHTTDALTSTTAAPGTTDAFTREPSCITDAITGTTAAANTTDTGCSS